VRRPRKLERWRIMMNERQDITTCKCTGKQVHCLLERCTFWDFFAE
jgi:hypothetical protein